MHGKSICILYVICHCKNFLIASGEVLFEEYTLEYGKDRLEMHVGAVEPGEHALVVDDLIATGGTLCAAMNLLGNFHLNFQDNLLTKY